jgi:hypothetical protein
LCKLLTNDATFKATVINIKLYWVVLNHDVENFEENLIILQDCVII